MIVFIALDDNNGMMFNNRRQSQDRIIRQHMLDDCRNSTLWIAEYSKKLFLSEDDTSLPDNLIVDDDFLNKAGIDDYCFVENRPLKAYIDKIHTLVIFKWNRIYPADLHFDSSILNNGWNKIFTTEFVGSSHDLITKEVWKRA